MEKEKRKKGATHGKGRGELMVDREAGEVEQGWKRDNEEGYRQAVTQKNTRTKSIEGREEGTVDGAPTER